MQRLEGSCCCRSGWEKPGGTMEGLLGLSELNPFISHGPGASISAKDLGNRTPCVNLCPD